MRARATARRASLAALRPRCGDRAADDLSAGGADLIHFADQALIDLFAIRNLVRAMGLGVREAGLPLLRSLGECVECGGRCQDGECEHGAVKHGFSLGVKIALSLRWEETCTSATHSLRPSTWRSRGFGSGFGSIPPSSSITPLRRPL